MRNVFNINKQWKFYKGVDFSAAREGEEFIDLPHTWNAVDGQDGGNDYFRGACLYVKNILKSEYLNI